MRKNKREQKYKRIVRKISEQKEYLKDKWEKGFKYKMSFSRFLANDIYMNMTYGELDRLIKLDYKRLKD